MAEELPPINQDILKEQKETTNALASVIVEMRKQGGNERNSLNKLQSVKDVITNLTNKEIEASRAAEKSADDIQKSDSNNASRTSESLKKIEKNDDDNSEKTSTTLEEGFANLKAGFDNVAQTFSGVTDAFQSDVQKLLGPLSLGLQALPGFETAQAITKLILQKSFGSLIKLGNDELDFQRRQAKKEDRFRRLQKSQLASEGAEKKAFFGAEVADEEAGFMTGLLKTLRVLAIGILAPFIATFAFVKGFTTGQLKLINKLTLGIFPKIANGFKALGSLIARSKVFTTVTSNISKIFAGFKPLANPRIAKLVSGFGQFVGRITGFFSQASKGAQAFIKSSAALGNISRIFGFLGRIFAPIRLIIGLFAGVQSAVADFQSEEGGFAAKLFAGFMGFAKGLFQSIVGSLLDAIKGAFAFILDKFGLDKAAELLRSFQFSDLIGKAFDTVTSVIKSIVSTISNFAPALFAGFKAAFDAFSITSPGNMVTAFKEGFKARFEGGGGGGGDSAPAADDMAVESPDTGTTIGEGSTALKTREVDPGGSLRDSKGNLINTVVNNSTVNNSNNFNPENTSTGDQAFSAAGD